MLIVSYNCAVRFWAKMLPFEDPLSSRSIAVPPNKANHKKHINAGATMAPTTNSRMVRFFEILARKIPTNGANAIHQAQ